MKIININKENIERYQEYCEEYENAKEKFGKLLIIVSIFTSTILSPFVLPMIVVLIENEILSVVVLTIIELFLVSFANLKLFKSYVRFLKEEYEDLDLDCSYRSLLKQIDEFELSKTNSKNITKEMKKELSSSIKTPSNLENIQSEINSLEEEKDKYTNLETKSNKTYKKK